MVKVNLYIACIDNLIPVLSIRVIVNLIKLKPSFSKSYSMVVLADFLSIEDAFGDTKVIKVRWFNR